MGRTRLGCAVLLALLAAACGSSPAGRSPSGGPTSGGPTGAADPLADQIAIVAIALGGTPGAHTRPPVHTFVDDRYCRIVDTDRRAPCPVRPIPAAVRQGVLRIVGGGYRFVAHTPEPSRNQVVAALGAPVIRGDTATIAVDSMCGPLCGSGTSIHLRRDAGRWHQVGPRETDWIS